MPIETFPAKKALQKYRKGHTDWDGIDYALNIYRGCSFGCIYCESRSNCYNMRDFDTIRVRQDALAMLARDTANHRPGVVALGVLCDTYGAAEAELGYTGSALQMLARGGFGAAIETKNSLITRDIDKLGAIGRRSAAIVRLSVTAADADLARILEPGAPVPDVRFAALRDLSGAGIFCGITLTPVLPFITDAEENIRELVERAYENGARFVYARFGISMRDGQREYFYQKIKQISTRLPRRYIEAFGVDYYCYSPHHEQLFALFTRLCEERGLLHTADDIMAGALRSSAVEQFSLF